MKGYGVKISVTAKLRPASQVCITVRVGVQRLRGLDGGYGVPPCEYGTRLGLDS